MQQKHVTFVSVLSFFSVLSIISFFGCGSGGGGGTDNTRTGGIAGRLASGPDGKTILTGEDNWLRLWEVESGKELRALSGHAERVTSAQFSSDGKTVLTVSWNGHARLWDVGRGKQRDLWNFV